MIELEELSPPDKRLALAKRKYFVEDEGVGKKCKKIVFVRMEVDDMRVLVAILELIAWRQENRF